MKTIKDLIHHYKTMPNTNPINCSMAWKVACSMIDKIHDKHLMDDEEFWDFMKDLHEDIEGKHFNEIYAKYQVSKMHHHDNKGNVIKNPIFDEHETEMIYNTHSKSLSKAITKWDLYVALNAQYNDNMKLYKKWFPEASEDEIKHKVIEATIVDWFADEDADDEKVWKYFRAI